MRFSRGPISLHCWVLLELSYCIELISVGGRIHPQPPATAVGRQADLAEHHFHETVEDRILELVQLRLVTVVVLASLALVGL
ncbi:hypothetical protein D6T63_17635 [Arthrobacter cheniae]|uniref:Uncharacterized protein n=1 Tax=Arthrobacter cheniae TaxID=1258888 RepID=A0A3A5M7K4_9MICC|nr:hypothetical protein D6T63_17635 [Arthrobacter cheniae]